MKNELLLQLKQSSPRLVASLDGDDLPDLLEQARVERADIVEIRLDLWGDSLRDDMVAKLARFKEKIGIPMLISFRGGNPFPRWWETVHWRSLVHAAMVDFEWNPKYPWREILKQVRQQKLALMISHHDYKSTPKAKALVKIGRLALSKKADIIKLATRVKDKEDVRTLLEVCAALAHKSPVAVMGMGPLGQISRLSAPLFGSAFIYGFIGSPTANGQLQYRDLQERIRVLYPGESAGIRKDLHG